MMNMNMTMNNFLLVCNSPLQDGLKSLLSFVRVGAYINPMTKMNKIKIQADREITSNQDYDKWSFKRNKRREGEVQEPIQANPDSLSEADSFFYQNDASKETTERVNQLMLLAPKFLTEKQWRVFESQAIHMNSPKETAVLLGITRSTVDKHFKAAQRRLQKLYETI